MRCFSQRYQGQYEISALVGNVTRQEGKPYLHLHITIGSPVTGEVHAGHLSACTISATLELFCRPGTAGSAGNSATPWG